jgi:hypothetical protein
MKGDSMKARPIVWLVRLSPLAILACLLFVTGCGSGGGGGTPPSGSNTGKLGGTITEASRQKALDEIKSVYEKLPRTDRAADSQTLLAYLKSRSELSRSEIAADGSVWGWFVDGQPICLVNNEPYGQVIGRSAITVRSRAAPQVEFPTGNTAKLFQSFGTLDLIVDPRRDIEPMLKDAGYQVASPFFTGVNVNTWRTLGKVDVLFTNTHGGLGFKDGDPTDAAHFWPHYCLWTDQKVVPLTDWADGALQDDLSVGLDTNGNVTKRPRLVRMLADVNWIGFKGITPVNEWHYALTAEFVRRYLQFGKHSLWFSNACSSASGLADLDTADFHRAAFEKGLSVFAGWDNSADRQQANRAATYAFDRMLGANRYQAETPKQRAFDWRSVQADMAGKKLDETRTDQPGVVSKLKFVENPANAATEFGLLAPSIESMSVDEKTDTLHLFGTFGTRPDSSEKVTINGASLSIKDWQPDHIQCAIERRGANSSGDVLVSVNDHDSNTATLTAWEGTVRYKTQGGHTFVAWPLWPELSVSVTLKVRFRADVRSRRVKPGTAPDPAFTGASADRSSTYEWSGAGTHVYDDGSTHSLSASGSSGFTGSTDGFSVSFNMAAKEARVFFHFSKGAALHFTSTTVNPPGSSSSDVALNGGSVEAVPKGQSSITSTIGSDYTIKGQNITFNTQASSTTGGNYTTTVSWTDLRPINPPKETTARNVRR